MIAYPDIDPVLIHIGPISIRWYGLMYLAGFTASYMLVKYQINKKKLAVKMEDIDSLFSYCVIGLIVGARIGYIIFYNLDYYVGNPLEALVLWQGGLSFHGGLVGAVTAGAWYVKKRGLDFWTIADLVIVTAPIGLGLGRLGNFINGELYGRVTDVYWGMVFPSGGPLPRHPSQLYELLFEGIVLFILLWIIKDRGLKPGSVTSFFLIFYGIFRFFIEFFREPDVQVGYFLGFITMGQILCFIMIVSGLLILFFRNKKR